MTLRPHPEFADAQIPAQAAIGAFRLSMLTPEDADEDFAAISASIPVLQGVFGDDWPKGLTLDRNRADLARHQREFEARFAFSWIIRSRDGAYLGCAYFRPTPSAMRQGRAAHWIMDRPDRLELLSEFGIAFRPWLGRFLPQDYEMTWYCNDWPTPTGP